MFIGTEGHAKFKPEATDSIRELRWKAESMLEFLREHATQLRRFPNSAVDDRLTMWQELAELLARVGDAVKDVDARLEAQRVWAEETRRAAMNVITMGALAHSPSAQQRFAGDPETLDALIQRLDQARPFARSVLSQQDLNTLRAEGFLFEGE